MRVAVLLLFLTVACSTQALGQDPILVGQGPCSDEVHGAVYNVEGCLGVLLVEATRTAKTSGELVEGRVLEAGSLHPIPGVNIIHLSKQRGTWTDKAGRFALDSLHVNDRLRVSFIGFWGDTLHVGSLPGPRLPKGSQ